MNSPSETSSITGTSSSRSSPELTGKAGKKEDDTQNLTDRNGSLVPGSVPLIHELDALCLKELDRTEQGIDDFLNSTLELGRCELRYGTVHVLEMPDFEHIVIAHFLLCLFLRVKFHRQDNDWNSLHGFIEANVGEKSINSSLQADFSIGRISSDQKELKGKIAFTSNNLPNVIVEVTSSNFVNDTETKRKIYAEIGVPLYIIVHRMERELWVFTLEEDGDDRVYKNPQKYNENDTYTSPYFGNLVVKELLEPNADEHLNLPAEMRKERDQAVQKLAAALDEARREREKSERLLEEKEHIQREAKSEREKSKRLLEEKKHIQREAERLREDNERSKEEAEREREKSARLLEENEHIQREAKRLREDNERSHEEAKRELQDELQKAMARIAELEEQARNS